MNVYHFWLSTTSGAKAKWKLAGWQHITLRVRVTEVKYVVLEPVYQIIRAPRVVPAHLAANKQLDPRGP